MEGRLHKQVVCYGSEAALMGGVCYWRVAAPICGLLLEGGCNNR